VGELLMVLHLMHAKKETFSIATVGSVAQGMRETSLVLNKIERNINGINCRIKHQ